MDTTTIFQIMARIDAINESYENPNHEVMASEWAMQAGARYALGELKEYLQDYVDSQVPYLEV